MLEIGTALNVGIRRRGAENQDSLHVLLPSPINPKAPLFVVADGMGGYHGGAIASQLVVETLVQVYQQAKKEVDPLTAVYEGVSAAHRAIIQKARQNPDLKQMGSTVVAAVLEGDTLHLVNVGDSRAYIVNEEKILQVSWDHSLLAEEIRNNHLTPEQVRDYPRKNVLTMSLSAQRPEVEPFTAAIHLGLEDQVLLCSDGLWGAVTEAQIQAIVLEMPAQRAADKLVELANANQGPDNISVIIVRRSPLKDDADEDTRKLTLNKTAQKSRVNI